MISRALTIKGWMTPDELTWLAGQAKTHEKIAEVGSWLGRSTAAIADNTQGIVFAIDTWMGSSETDFDPGFKAGGPEWLFGQFMENAADNVTPIRMESVEAAAYLARKKHLFDMIFIDGAHDMESVKADIEAWRPLLKEGGLFCGHDYCWPDTPTTEVKKAVDQYFLVDTASSIWIMRAEK